MTIAAGRLTISLVPLIATALAPPAGGQRASGPLFPGAQYPTDFYPEELACSDLDGDGDLDVVVMRPGPSIGTGAFLVLPGRGDGTLGPATTYELELELDAVGVGDLNGDAMPDVVGGGYGLLGVSLGTGGGAFASPVDYEGLGGRFATLGDVDGDGALDVVSAASQVVAVRLGLGDGSLGDEATYGGWAGFPRDVQLADVDADGGLDVLVVTSAEPVAVLRGLGDGSFGPPELTPTLPDARDLEVCDLDADGDLDLATARGGVDFVSIYPGNGDGTFGSPERAFVGQSQEQLEAADLDRDGVPDLVCVTLFGRELVVLRGVGGGAFEPARASYPVGYNLDRLAIADLEGDGVPDALGLYYNGINAFTREPLLVLTGTGNAGFRAAERIEVLGGAAIAPADFDGDGHLDLALDAVGDVQLLLADPRGGFGLPTTWDAAGMGDDVLTADVDGDGNADVVATSGSEGDVAVLLGDGQGSLRAPALLGVKGSPRGTELGDVNGDGVLDLVLADTDAEEADHVLVHLGAGDGTFGPPLGLSVQKDPVLSVALGDGDADGKLDLVATVQSGKQAQFFPGVGDGTFASPTTTLLGLQTNHRKPLMQDLDGDGDDDLLLPDGYFGLSVSVFLSDGEGDFEQTGHYEGGPFVMTIATGDVTGDGHDDLISAEEKEIVVLEGDGAGNFAPFARFGAIGSTGPEDVAVLDVDDDGDLDLAVRTSMGVSLLRNQREE